MLVVAISLLATSIGDEVPFLAAALGVTQYEARAKLAQPPPIVLLRTGDRDGALALLANLRARHHEVIACDEAALEAPIQVRTFKLAPLSFDANGDVALAYADILLLVRAASVTQTETVEHVSERKFRPAAAIISGGLILSKKVVRDEKRIARDKEDWLYVFSRHGGAPLLLTERGTQYGSLDSVAPTQRENFLRVTTELRARANSADFDERLLARRGDDPADIHLRAQLLAIAAARKSGLYR